MKDLKTQFNTFEQGRQLYLLGFKPNGFLSWEEATLYNDGEHFENVPMIFRNNTGEYEAMNLYPFDDKWEDAVSEDYGTTSSIYPCLNVSEMGDLLGELSNQIYFGKDKKWHVDIEYKTLGEKIINQGNGLTKYSSVHDNMAWAYADLLIYAASHQLLPLLIIN